MQKSFGFDTLLFMLQLFLLHTVAWDTHHDRYNHTVQDLHIMKKSYPTGINSTMVDNNHTILNEKQIFLRGMNTSFISNHRPSNRYDQVSTVTTTATVNAQRLPYFGGPVIANVKVVTIWWGAQVRYTSQLESFYSAITTSNWYRIFTQYNTSITPNIGYGQWIQSYNYSNAPNGTVTDEQSQTHLQLLISTRKVPQVDNNTYYAIHFAPGIKIDIGSYVSCMSYCAYHYTMWNVNTNGKVNSKYPYIYYGVMPDQGGGCSYGCGADPVPLNNLFLVASHELAEVVTDPCVGVITDYAYPLAWYSITEGEVGDICTGIP